MKKLVVFDLDGTLHHTELALAPAIARAAAEVTGLQEPSYELINSLYGEPLEEFCRVLTGRSDRKTFERFMEGVRRHQSITIPEMGALYPGTVEMLQKLKEGDFDLAVLSNAHGDYMEEVTDNLGIRQFFKQLVGRGHEASKTDRLKVLSAGYDFTVMVGDRYHDIQAAQELALPGVACLYGYGSEKEHTGALKASSPGDVLELIEELLREETGIQRRPCPQG